MPDGGFLQRFVEVSQELFPVIGDDLADTSREHRAARQKKCLTILLLSDGQRVVAVFVDHGNDITAQLAHSKLNSIHANELTGLYRVTVLWSAGLCGAFFNEQDFSPGTQSHWY